MEYIFGDKGTNKQGLDFEVSRYLNAKNIWIKFKIDGAELKTTRAYLVKGLPMHPKYGKPQIGDTYKDSSGNLFKLLARNPLGNHDWFIEWLHDGTRASREYKSIKGGTVQYPVDTSYKTGTVITPKNGYTFEVIKQNNSLDVDIRFIDGTLAKTDAASIRKGVVGHPTSGLILGQSIETNSKWKGEILYYNNCHDVGIKWQDGSTSSHPAGHIKSGGIKPLFQPSVANKGFFGEGRFVNTRMAKGEYAPDVIYRYWSRMVVRCYEPLELAKPKGIAYEDVYVCDEWLNFQNFAEWALKQTNWNLGHELDKDLIGTGYFYCPEYCTFLPANINTFLSDQYGRIKHDLPKGVQYLQPGTAGAKVGYVARCHTDQGREYLGYHNTPEAAFAVYKKAKEAYAKILAERYKGCITTPAYEKLLAFTVEP